ncbi:unnamed protein product [Lymnaea stagnalis]|uniref:Uncharacterized protein n=1 Tax=Lymnaea stagnalis TaxID=6523 RepID=A0AAV2HST0_LYMST
MADGNHPPPLFPSSNLMQSESQNQPQFYSPSSNNNMTTTQSAQVKPPALSPNGPFSPYQPGSTDGNHITLGGPSVPPNTVNGLNTSSQQQMRPSLMASGFPPPPGSNNFNQPPMSNIPIRPGGPYPPHPNFTPLAGPQMNGPGNVASRPPFPTPPLGSQTPGFQGPTPPYGNRTPLQPGGAMRPPPPSLSGPGQAPPTMGFQAMSGDTAQSRPNELPVPFHGQGQYSHQVNPHMQKTPTPTPSNSEPPSERSSRGPSPVSGSTMDALEGQFSPGHGSASPALQGNRASPVQSLTPGTPPKMSGGYSSTMQNQQFPPRPGLPPSHPWPGSQQQQTQYQSQPRPPTSQGFPPLPSQATGFPSSQPRFPPHPASSTSSGFPPHPNPQVFPPPPSTSNTAAAFSPPQMPGMPRFQPPPPVAGFPLPPLSSGPLPPTFGASPNTTYAGSPPPLAGAPLQNVPGYSPNVTSDGTMPPQYGNMPPASQGGYPHPQFVQPSFQQPGVGYPNNVNAMTQNFGQMGIQQDAPRAVNLLTERQLIPADGLETSRPVLPHDFKKVNCSPDIFRCTLNAIPQNSALLNKARLPLGILIHPFRDLSQLPVIQSSVIVRCRACRTYINPFVVFTDQRRWKCNLCFRVNDLPDEFSFDPVSKTYGDPQRRPEVKSATIEFIAPSEYMLRPPQPAVYLFLLDVSFNAVKTGYLTQFCQILIEEIDKLPGDNRKTIGFLCYDKALYYFNLAAGLSQAQMLCVPDLEDPFLPCPDNLLVNLKESKELLIDLLNKLPSLFEGNYETGSALGAALQSAHKLMSPTGGRITVMQTCLPTVGPGALENRDASSSAGKNVTIIGPATDFYKKLSLDCSAQQIAVDLFMLNAQYADIATLACISKFSAGCVNYYPSYHSVKNLGMVDKFDTDFRRYLTRKIGFESVMRIRCTRGLSIHTFHGNFFVRSTDLLSLPNINPDAGFGMQMSIEDNLQESSTVSFQAALLYTSSKGERRIRVHTLCVPVTNQLSEVFACADQLAVASLLSKMAVDRSLNSAISDARDAMMNASLDALSAYAQQIPASQRVGALLAPHSLRLMPMFMLAMLKSVAFALAGNPKVDDRVFAMQQFKVMPLCYLIQNLYPHLYPLLKLNEEKVIKHGDEEIPSAPLLQLSSANIDRTGLFLMDTGDAMYLLVGSSVGDQICQDVFNKPNFMSIPDGIMDLPELENQTSENIRSFINYLMDSRPNGVVFLVVRDDSKNRHLFFQHMLEDRSENSMSYYEFLQFLQGKAKP